MAVPNSFATATSAIPLANLDANFQYYDNAFTIAGTVMEVNYTFRLEDPTDNTKKAQFVMSGITTATTRQYTLPNITGTLATLANTAQTFTGATTFSSTFTVNGNASIYGMTVGRGLANLATNVAVGGAALGATTTGSGNTAVGANAADAITTGASNVAIGSGALGAAQTVSSVIAIGAAALTSATAGDNNIAIGASSMNGAVTGGNNTAVGTSSLNANTSGAENTSVGYLSMSSNTTGANNTALGRRALWGNSTTSNNTAIGYFALDDVLTAGNGTAVGAGALTAATGGSNTALGYNAGSAVTTGASNLFVGTVSGALMTTGSNNVVVGSYQGNSGGLDIRAANGYIVLSDGAANIRQVIDSSGNAQFPGAIVVDAPAPAAISAAATLTNANIQAQIINTTGTTYTVTMPLGTTMETLVPWIGVDLGYDFTIINTASGTITMAVNTGVTSLGSLTIATGVSANFRIRRTATNTFILYRIS